MRNSPPGRCQIPRPLRIVTDLTARRNLRKPVVFTFPG
jgi:hypothetical protein